MKICEFSQSDEKINDEEAQIAGKFFKGRWYTSKSIDFEIMIWQFSKLGWTPIGEGAYGIVFENKNKNFVLKVSKHPDPAYDSYVKMIKNNPNPHFPKISDLKKIVIKSDEYYIYLIEKLKHLDSKIGNVFSSLVTMLIRGYTIDQIKSTLQNTIWLTTFDRIIKKPQLLEAIELIAKLAKEHMFELDLHNQNVMYRPNGAIVITDPYVMR